MAHCSYRGREVLQTAHEGVVGLVLQVEALASKRVIHVACGVWHTAAVAAEPIGSSSPLPALSELNYTEAEALRHKLSAAYDMLDEVVSLF